MNRALVSITHLSDFLMMLLHDLLPIRKDLKLVLMSATINAEKFSAYFNSCPIIEIPGFTHPVQEFYLEDVIQRTNYKLNSTPKHNMARKNIKSIDYYAKTLPSMLSYSQTPYTPIWRSLLLRSCQTSSV